MPRSASLALLAGGLVSTLAIRYRDDRTRAQLRLQAARHGTSGSPGQGLTLSMLDSHVKPGADAASADPSAQPAGADGRSGRPMH